MPEQTPNLQLSFYNKRLLRVRERPSIPRSAYRHHRSLSPAFINYSNFNITITVTGTITIRHFSFA